MKKIAFLIFLSIFTTTLFAKVNTDIQSMEGYNKYCKFLDVFFKEDKNKIEKYKKDFNSLTYLQRYGIVQSLIYKLESVPPLIQQELLELSIEYFIHKNINGISKSNHLLNAIKKKSEIIHNEIVLIVKKEKKKKRKRRARIKKLEEQDI